MFALALCFVQRFALVTSPKTWTVKYLHSVSLSERLEFWLNALSLPQAETTCAHLGGNITWQSTFYRQTSVAKYLNMTMFRKYQWPLL